MELRSFIDNKEWKGSWMYLKSWEKRPKCDYICLILYHKSSFYILSINQELSDWKLIEKPILQVRYRFIPSRYQ